MSSKLRSLLLVGTILLTFTLSVGLAYASDPIGITVSPGELNIYGYTDRVNTIKSVDFGSILFGNPTTVENALWFNLYLRNLDGETPLQTSLFTVEIQDLNAMNDSSLNPSEKWYVYFTVVTTELPEGVYQFYLYGQLRPLGSPPGSSGAVGGRMLINIHISDNPKVKRYSLTVAIEPVEMVEIHSRVYVNGEYKATHPLTCIGGFIPGEYEVFLEDTNVYRFVEWTDGTTDNPRNFTITDRSIKVWATFEAIPTPFWTNPFFIVGIGLAGVIVAYLLLWKD